MRLSFCTSLGLAVSSLAASTVAQVQLDPPPERPAALGMESWREVDAWADRGEHWDFRQPSHFAEWSQALVGFAGELGPLAERSADPLGTVRALSSAMHRAFAYAPNTTRVDSPIAEALASRRGVCQDFTHIMLALLRRLGLPCRYVSGYIAPRALGEDDGPTTIATHAWVEVHDGTRFVRIDLGGAGNMLRDPLSGNVPFEGPPDPFSWPVGATRGDELGERAREVRGHHHR